MKVFESYGKRYEDIIKDDLRGTYTSFSPVTSNPALTNPTFLFTISERLPFHRFYYIHVTAIQGLNTQAELQSLFYTVPLKSEQSKLEFFGSVGTALFAKSRKSGIDPNISFSTGLKFLFKPISTNPDLERHDLWPRASRWSFVFGTVINNLTYKTSDITAAIFGMKPLLALNFDFSENIGLYGGVVLGRQDTKSQLTSHQGLVSGLSFGISFSSNVFKKLGASIPASQNFPKLENQNL